MQTKFSDVCVHELFERQVVRDPGAVAIVFEAQQLSYRQLNERANQLARHLRRRGVGPESLVGVSLRRSPLMVIALLGVWKAGGAYVPLDPAYPRARLSFMVDDADLRLLLTDDHSRQLFGAAGDPAGTHAAFSICLDSDWPLIAQERSDNLAVVMSPANLAYVMYTSGSTGKPKGAMITHGGLANYLCWAIKAYAVAAGGSVPLHSSLSFDLTVTSLYVPLLAGAQVELLREDSGAQNLLLALRARKRSLVKITPAHLALLEWQLSAAELAGMTDALVIGGENLTAERLSPWREHAPATRLINEYGPTETVVGCCTYEVRADDPRNGSVPIGRPIANTQLYVLDVALRPVPPGTTGELYIGGAGVARGYLNRPELTRERFLPDPFAAKPGARLYKTGDIARYRQQGDGVLEYLGRSDQQIKILGYRIELGEIEQALAGHPEVHACAVLVQARDRDDQRLVAFVVFRRGVSLPGQVLRNFLKQQLPPYMMPAQFVMLDALPLTTNGKLDRPALLALLDIETQSRRRSRDPSEIR